jgi:hypothetical protein
MSAIYQRRLYALDDDSWGEAALHQDKPNFCRMQVQGLYDKLKSNGQPSDAAKPLSNQKGRQHPAKERENIISRR